MPCVYRQMEHQKEVDDLKAKYDALVAQHEESSLKIEEHSRSLEQLRSVPGSLNFT